VFRLAFHEPRIPQNTGNAIRTAAATGCELHLIGPLGFELTDSKLRRAGLDYHDLATVLVHENYAAAWAVWASAGESPRVFAFSAAGTVRYDRTDYRPGDVLFRHRAERPAGPGARGSESRGNAPYSDAGRPPVVEPVQRRRVGGL